ncbi:MAG: hypothetical protein J6D08_09185 [Lachnospiraceae bacterium]|nr:hypothetical protein [Lachnospiraceae bacterium]
MELNLENEEFKTLPLIDIEKLSNKHLDLVIYEDGNLYVLDVSGEFLIQYSLSTFHYKYINIGCNKHKDSNFACLCAYNRKVYIFTREQRELIVYDVVKDAAERIQYPDVYSEYYITGCKLNDSYFIFPKNGKDVLEYDFIQNKWKIHCLHLDLVNCMHAIAENEYIYILLASGSVLKWNYYSEKIEIIVSLEEIYKASNAASRICLTKEEIIILPSVAQDIIKVDRVSNKISTYKDYPKDFSYASDKKHWSKYYGYCENDTEYYFACRTSGYILKIEKQNGRISWIKSEIDKREMFRIYLERNKSFVYEKEGDLELLTGLKNKERVEDIEKLNNGCKIWKEINIK